MNTTSHPRHHTSANREKALPTTNHSRSPRAHWAYTWIPLLTALLWFTTVLALLAKWLAQGRPHYVSMSPGQTIAYISDVAADVLKPLFIVGCAITAVGFFASLALERWARHDRRLLPNTRRSEKISSILAILFSLLGGAGLILLSIFDTKRHPHLHRLFLLLFVAGVALSAIFSVLEYYLLYRSTSNNPPPTSTANLHAGRWRHHRRGNMGGTNERATRRHRTLYLAKLLFTVVLIALAIAFGVLLINGTHQNTAAIIEWVIAFGFTLYLLTFYGDLRETKPGRADGAVVV